MEKIANYIKNGKGNGLLFILAAAVLMTMALMFWLKQEYRAVEPQILKAAEDVLPITVKDGKIVDPVGVYKQTAIQLGEDGSAQTQIPVILDTRDEVSQIPSEKLGLFIMRDVIYMISPNKIERIQFQDGVLDISKAKELISYFMSLMSMISSIVCVLLFYFVVLIKTLIAAVCGVLSLKVMQKPELFSFSALMRVSALVVSGIELICFLLSFWGGLGLSGFSKLLFEIIILWLYLSKETKNQE